MTDLDRLRVQLDHIDHQLVDLIAQRLEIVAEVGAAKAGSDTPVRDPDRERAVLEKVARAAGERGIPGELVQRVFREIIGYAVDKQVAELLGRPEHPAVVGFQGVEHAYSHLAARKHLSGRGWAAQYRGYPSFAEVVAALVSGECELAVLPIENTTAGSINQVYDLLQDLPLHVVGEETWRVDHALAAVADVAVTSLRRVLSHPQGLEQCAAYLRTLPDVLPVTVFDTAEAMRLVAAEGDPAWAAIGPPEAADAHDLVVLRRRISDREQNYTRFVVLAREPVVVALRVPAKTSLVLVTSHEEGALLRCLDVLVRSHHSMTKLESRPLPGRPFEYLFFLDFEGNVAEPRTQQVLDELRQTAVSVKVLGSYPAKLVRAEASAPGGSEAVALRA
jgi:chorismate mutase/prephenate dehydratase